MQIGGSDEEDVVISTINTTPLVDVMLVLLIIFLITVPVTRQMVPVALPSEHNQPDQTRPKDIVISVDKDGDVFWNNQRVSDNTVLLQKMEAEAVKVPQPEVHIRGDQQAHYQAVGAVVNLCQRAGIAKVGFILQPPPRG